MGIQITICGNNAAEVAELVWDLSSTMKGMKLEDIPAETTVSTVEEKPKRRTKTEKPVEEKQPDPTATSEDCGPADEDAPIPSVVDLRAMAQKLGATPEGKAGVKALLKEFGCAAISAVPEDERTEFMARLEAL